jgi:hypothetical protein
MARDHGHTYTLRMNVVCELINASMVMVPDLFMPGGFQAEQSRSQWPRGLRHRSAAESLLGSWVRIPPGKWIFVSC